MLALFSVYIFFISSGVNIRSNDRKHQAIGFEDAIQRAEEKIKAALQIQKSPVIAVENFILQQDEQWFDLSVLVLSDSDKGIVLRTFSQTTPIPLEAFLDQAELEMPNYAKGCESVEKLLAAYLQVGENVD